MTGPQIIVLATPVFLLLIAIEFIVGWRRGRNTYRLNDALNSIGLGVFSQVIGVFSALPTLAIYIAVFEHLAPWKLSAQSAWVWLGGLVLYDFCYYWLHRCGHTVALVDLLYQYWVHTQQIGKLGWFDRWFCAPSNHRVHHAVNDRYLDKNFGGILIVWDRLFGSFEPEDDAEPCVYGTRGPLRSWNPLWANLHTYAGLARDSWRAASWADKLRVWFKPPGWRPADVARRWPQTPFEIAQVERYDPPMSRTAAAVAVSLFLAVLGATTLFLWFAHRLTGPEQVGVAALIGAGLWAIGRACAPAKSPSVFSRG